jgi:CheY-like chemotaxis protein
VSDINMPGTDGYDLARRLRVWAAGRPLLLIAVTARTTDEDRRRSAEAGFDRHFNKPADPIELVEEVARFGSRHRLNEQADPAILVGAARRTG